MDQNRARIIAEVGNTHEGSLGLAIQFIRAVAEVGGDAVKFQTHIFQAESVRNAPNPPYFKGESRETYFERTSFTLEEWIELRREAQSLGLQFLSSPFSLEAVDLLEAAGLESYKIASGEVTNTPLLEKIAATGKPVILSSGMSTWQELDLAVAALREGGCSDLTLMQCTSKYPCPPEDAGLESIAIMNQRYQLPVGFSDHTEGLGVPVAAVALGACMIEKHFTLSKKMYGPDAALSAEPHEFSAMVRAIRQAETAVSKAPDKNAITRTLDDMKQIFEKSVVASQPLSKGTKLEKKHLAFKKPGTGFPAAKYQELLGRHLLVDAEADQPLALEDTGEQA